MLAGKTPPQRTFGLYLYTFSESGNKVETLISVLSFIFSYYFGNAMHNNWIAVTFCSSPLYATGGLADLIVKKF